MVYKSVDQKIVVDLYCFLQLQSIYFFLKNQK